VAQPGGLTLLFAPHLVLLYSADISFVDHFIHCIPVKVILTTKEIQCHFPRRWEFQKPIYHNHLQVFFTSNLGEYFKTHFCLLSLIMPINVYYLLMFSPQFQFILVLVKQTIEHTLVCTSSFTVRHNSILNQVFGHLIDCS